MAGAGTGWTQGAPCWVSLMTHDLDAARHFYGSLLGWEFAPGPDHLGPYLRALVDGVAVAGMGVVSAGLRVPRDWTTYFAADNADEVAQRIREYGGTVAVGPLEAERAGRLAVASDLFGAVFGIWEGMEHRGWGRYKQPGAVSWCELRCSEVRGSSAFYAGTFGLAAIETGPGEAELRAGGRSVAGIVRRPERTDDFLELSGGQQPRPRWAVFFAVEDIGKTVRRTAELGGTVVREPRSTRYGRVADLRDAEGVDFSVVEPAAA